MQIINFTFTKIESERKKPLQGKIEIGSNINIKSISEEKIEMFKDKNVLRFNFDFVINYKPETAHVTFEGLILATVDKKEHKEILAKWKTKKVADDIRIPLFNLILTKCNLRALQLEDELNLPAHIPLPQVSPPVANQGYVQ